MDQEPQPKRYVFRRKRAAAWTAEEVLALRRRLGLSQAAFADELGVRQQTVSEWETGRYLPRGASSRLLGMLAESARGDSPEPAEGEG
jgi:DNA-binding transcriptional regulator YiaG